MPERIAVDPLGDVVFTNESGVGMVSMPMDERFKGD